MALLKIPDDLHETLKSVQASLYLKYKKTLSQLDILFHVNKSEIKTKKHDEIADKIYNELTKAKQNTEVVEKKTNFEMSE